jgi:hypothetical protein
VQRAHRARELAHLEEELHAKARGPARHLPVGDPEPERMTPEGAAGVDGRAQVLDEGERCRHELQV